MKLTFHRLPSVVALSAAAIAAAVSVQGSPRSVSLLNDQWEFSLTPDSGSVVKPYTKIVDLPHDWSITLPYDRNAPAGNDGAYLPTGKGVYRKSLTMSAEDLAGKRHRLLFEGVYERWTLKVNGREVGFRPYGYSSVIYDITPYLVPGENSIEVDVDNSNQKNCRWYSGSGIYRNVKLLSTAETAIEPWSLFITTPKVDAGAATVAATFNVDGLKPDSRLTAEVEVFDGDGNKVGSASLPEVGNPPEVTLQVATPRLWSPESPSLYTMRLILKENGNEVDRTEETFGIRTITFSADDGLRLNGEPLILNGGCVHHDNGILGAASYDAAEARKVRLMKEAGFNAVRTSHNPPSPAFLDECDRQGLLVIDEAFDGWRDEKNSNDYHLFFDDWALADIEAMVRRDRNHPSIMAWSIGNEVMERKKIEIVTTARKLAAECKRNDPTRPVTQALCSWDADWEIYDPLAEELDIVGYNYMIHKSETDHQRDPQRVMWQTESYPADAFSNWVKTADNPYIIGDFVWTAIDYIGESGIGRYHYTGQTEGEHYTRPQWPWHGAYCGDIDITGWRKPISHYRDFLYNPQRKLYMAVREPDGYHGEVRTTQWGVWPTWESWNWEGHENKPVEVEVASRYPRVKLYLNGALLGEMPVSRENGYKAVFTIAYEPGVLRAVGVDENANEVEETTLETAGAPYAIRLTPDKTLLAADNQDISFVVAEVVDKQGRVVPEAAAPIEFSVGGPAAIIASGSADLASMDSYMTPTTTTWKGRAIVAVKSTHTPGSFKLTATSPKLKSATTKLKSAK